MYMLERRRATALTLTAMAVLGASACTSGGSDTDSGSAAASSSGAGAPAAVYGSSDVPTRPDPTDVATDPPAEAPATGSGVPVIVTYSGWEDTSAAIEVGAYISGVIEDGGTCTLTLHRDGAEVTASAAGMADASSTTCGRGLTVPGAELSPGTWEAVVSYESPTSSGTSDDVEVEVP
jgi:hypothetical protein